MVKVQHSCKQRKKKICDCRNKVQRKMKSKKSLFGRFKFTGCGKLMRTRAGRCHNLRKRGKRCKRLPPMVVACNGVKKMILKLIPYKKYIR